jgi:3-oxoisoapionate kinase
MNARSRPLRLAFYGDDFTGSTDALEVLAFAGLRCALFLEVPDAAMLAALGPFDAIGVAGDSRAMTPAEMDQRLAPVLQRLAALPTPLVHYKVCSTFDSAPSIGSIGHVMDLARAAFGVDPIPIIAATPALGRYCVFGQLFARSATDGQVYRIDRHPIMSVHPVTPMGEADLVRHLGAQTAQRIGKFTLPQFEGGNEAAEAALERLLQSGVEAVVFDGSSPAHLTQLGRLLERLCEDPREDPGRGRGSPRLCVGSSGLEYALTQWWQERDGAVATATDTFARFDGVPQVLAVSGSASALSASQIDVAIAAGFEDLPVDACALVADSGWQAELDALSDRIKAALRAGRSVMLHTARGPGDPRIAALTAALAAQGWSAERARHEGGRLLGQRLGQLVDRVLRSVPLRRLLLSGGDTSSQVTQALAPQALEIAARLAPGAPLCRLRSSQPHLSELQVALKGGQMGSPDFFVTALRGTA